MIIPGTVTLISLFTLFPLHLDGPEADVVVTGSIDCDFQVSGFLDRAGVSQTYIPLMVQIYNQGRRVLEIDAQQFTLETEEGKRFKPIDPVQFQSRFRVEGILHKKMMETLSDGLKRPRAWRKVDSRFYPLRGSVRASVSLQPGEVFYDVLYFERPRGGGLSLEWSGLRRSLVGLLKF